METFPPKVMGPCQVLLYCDVRVAPPARYMVLLVKLEEYSQRLPPLPTLTELVAPSAKELIELRIKLFKITGPVKLDALFPFRTIKGWSAGIELVKKRPLLLS